MTQQPKPPAKPRSVADLAEAVRKLGSPGDAAKPRKARQLAEELRDRLHEALGPLALAYAAASDLADRVEVTHNPKAQALARAAAESSRPANTTLNRWLLGSSVGDVADKLKVALDDLDRLLTGR